MNKSWVERFLMPSFGIAWFKCDEESGNVLDSKGSFIGTPYNTTRVDDGLGGKALSFNGINSDVRFNGKIIPIGKKSIGFRINKMSNGGGYFLSNTIGYAHGNGIVFRMSDTGKIGIGLSKQSDTNFVIETFYSNTALEVGRWYDVLFTWDGTTNQNGVKLYIDDMSIPDIETTAKSIETLTPTDNLTIGRLGLNNEYPYWFKGQLDDIQIYNEVIDPIPKFSLIKNKDKIHILSEGTLQEVPVDPNNLTQQDFETYGMNEVPLNLSVLSNLNFEVLKWTDSKEDEATTYTLKSTSKEVVQTTPKNNFNTKNRKGIKRILVKDNSHEAKDIEITDNMKFEKDLGDGKLYSYTVVGAKFVKNLRTV